MIPVLARAFVAKEISSSTHLMKTQVALDGVRCKEHLPVTSQDHEESVEGLQQQKGKENELGNIHCKQELPLFHSRRLISSREEGGSGKKGNLNPENMNQSAAVGIFMALYL